jgi:hypothetical protein
MDRAKIQLRRLAENSGLCHGPVQRRASAESLRVEGETLYTGQPSYKKYDAAPIKLQAHGDHSESISFRNIWLRKLN